MIMSWVILLLFTSLEFNKQQIEKGKNTFIPEDVKVTCITMPEELASA